MQDLIASPGSTIASVVIIILGILIASAEVNAKIEIDSGLELEIAERLLRDLSEKTGLRSLSLSRKNLLVYQPKIKVFGGSRTMRQLITGAIDDSKNTFVIKDAADSTTIHFSRTDQGTVNVETGKTRYLVTFDFKDFEKSRRYSSDEALGSFSYGINLFHEIDHKVSYDQNDPIPPSGVRPDRGSQDSRGVIEKTNLVREELGLIPRDAKSKFGFRYGGFVGLFRNTYQILFRDKKGKRKFVRWKAV